MTPGAIVLAYHACDVTVRDGLVKGQLAGLTPSRGDYDWLGDGAYFFENDPTRAWHFAQEAHEHPERLYSRRPVATPAVVGAILCVHSWLDLSTQIGLANYLSAHESLEESQRVQGKPMPVNGPAFDGDTTILWRKLDCAVLNYLHRMRAEDGLPEIQAVRGAFYQGATVAGTSEFRTYTHVQIALRDPSCVVGWFLPGREKLMSEAQGKEAGQRLAAATAQRSAKKPRRRVGK